MAAPHVAGLAALLASAQRAEGRTISGPAIVQALRSSGRPVAAARTLDQGAGLPDMERAWQWLRSGREAPRYRVEALPSTVHRQPSRDITGSSSERLAPAAYRRDGTPLGADTVRRFRVSLVPDSGIARRARRYRLVSDAPWLRPATEVATIDASTGSTVIELRYDASQLRGATSGSVRGIAEDDSTGGAAFVLLNTVVVPDAEGSLATSGTVTAGTSKRWFVRIPEGAAAFAATISVRDTTMTANLSLFEPTGQPARGAKAVDVGEDTTRATSTVAREDVVPGIWEVVLQAMPGSDVRFELTVGPAPAPAPGPAVLLDTAFVASIDRGVWRRAMTVPAGARTMVLETSVTNSFWNAVTDFAVTLYDAADGARVGNDAFHFPWTRSKMELPERPDAWQAEVEYFAGFALPVGPQGDARVRIRFLAAEAGK
jgi:hypothetical protein